MRQSVRLALLAAAAACAQTVLAGPPELRSEGGLLVLPNVKVEKSSQPVDGRAGSRDVGMKAYRDQETGKLRKANPEELLEEAQSAAPANDPTAVQVTVSEGGRKSATLDESFMSYAVVRRAANGGLEMVCVTGEAQAQRALRAAPQAKGDHHAH